MSTDASRARAHYKWADRYKVQGEYKKSEAHTVRAKHYERRLSGNRPAFGANPQSAEPPTCLVSFSPHEQTEEEPEYEVIPGRIPFHGWGRVSSAKSRAVDDLIMKELHGTAGFSCTAPASTHAKENVNWSASRYMGSGIVYLNKTDEAGAAARSPLEDAKTNRGLVIVEDWREGMLVRREKQTQKSETEPGEWTPCDKHHVFAYYHYIMNGSKVTDYCDRVHDGWCNVNQKFIDEDRSMCSDPTKTVIIENQFFPVPTMVERLWSLVPFATGPTPWGLRFRVYKDKHGHVCIKNMIQK
jgi:hypothetical protein